LTPGWPKFARPFCRSFLLAPFSYEQATELRPDAILHILRLLFSAKFQLQIAHCGAIS
jgi:hypothetical protein